MRVFVTGGTGTIGTPVVAELLDHGHRVVGLARSDRSSAALEAAGAETVRGDLSDLEVLRSTATEADGVITLAFGNDYSTSEALERSIAQETAALQTLGDALVGSGKPLVTTSGTPWIEGRASTESDPLVQPGAVAGRALAVSAILARGDEGFRPVAIRLPRTVHENGRGGFAGLLTEAARRSGVVGYPGTGEQRWPAVHARDAAVLFRLALESAPAGTAWHAVADEGDAVRDIAAVIGRRLELPVEQVGVETFGPFGPIFAMDQPSTSALTREALGWRPTHPALLADLENIEP
jgi:nucleoside-diphosphate-sugar epimerase